MSKAVSILFVDDSDDDAKLALRALRAGGFDPVSRRVQTAAELEAALAHGSWDAVISDFSMPGFTGMDALRISRATGLDIPFILISGTIGENTAVEAMKAGASDYLMKANLARLAPALERELKEAIVRTARRRAESLTRAILESSLDCLVTIDDAGLIVEFNPAAVATFGWSRDEALGKAMVDLIVPPRLRDAHRRGLARYLAMGEGPVLGKRLELSAVRSDGAEFPIELTVAALEGTAKPMFTGFIRDITVRREAEGRLKRLNRVYAMLSGINALIVHAGDRKELFDEACRIAVEHGGFRMAWIGIGDAGAGSLKPVASAGDVGNFFDRRSQVRSGTREQGLVERVIAEGKTLVSNDVRLDPRIVMSRELEERSIRSLAIIPLVVGRVAQGVLVLYGSDAGFFDAEETRLLEELAANLSVALDRIGGKERLDYLAYYDALTGLANRTLFLERVSLYLGSAAGSGKTPALYLLDVERFRDINDGLGKPAGDALLRQLAAWLTARVSDVAEVARTGSDQFSLVLPEAKTESDVGKVLEDLMELPRHPFVLEGAEYRIAAKVGVAVYPGDGLDAETLFRHAEAALKKAKSSGERYLFYAQRMTEAVAGRLELENQLRHALANGEFVLHYQPKVSLATGKLTGVEALIRWNDPRTGLVPPGRFIPVLEESGLIHEVGRWALRAAITQYLRWRAAGLPAVRIAVNVSPLQLRNAGFIAEIRQAIGIDPNAAAGLELEITENVLMEDSARSIAALETVRAMGVTIAIDDFGTGFSSLSYLSRLPVDTLKIDGTFVANMTATPIGLALVSNITSLAHALRLTVVAEGVETEEQSRLLRLLNCDEMQGFLFSRPVPTEAFEEQFLLPVHAAVAT